MKKESVLVLGILISLGLVFAAHTITISQGSSVDEDVTNMFNISVNNSDVGVIANISEVNITLWGNLDFLADSNATDATTSTFTNTSTVLSWNNDGLVMNSTTNYFWFNATASTAGTYNITITTLNASGSFETNISITVNDTNAPSAVSFAAPGIIISSNLSQTSIPINISVSDEGTVDTINISLFNSTRDFINSSASALGNISYYYNFTGLSEGTYYINATVNDSAGNSNSSTTIAVILDTTAPTVTLSCTPDPVSASSTLTCTCTATDSGSGVASRSWTTNPSTSTPGDFTTQCSALDTAGNNGSASDSYTVASSSAATTGGATYTKTYAVDNEDFSKIKTTTKQLKKNERIRIKFETKKHNIGITALSTTSADIEVFSTLQKVSLIIGGEKMFDLDDDSVYDLKVILNSIESSKANLTLDYIQEEIPAEVIADDGDADDGGCGFRCGVCRDRDPR